MKALQFVEELSKKYGIPVEALIRERGGACPHGA